MNLREHSSRPRLRRSARLLALCAALLLACGANATTAWADASDGVPGIPRTDASAITAGGSHTCAIVQSGAVRCWGANGYGQLAQGSTTKVGDTPGSTTVAVDLGAGRTATAITTGVNHTCAILDNGTLRCWGYNQSGQLGQGNKNDIGDTPGETTVAVDLGAGRTATAIASNSFFSCAILDNGNLRCWGSNASGQLGQGNMNDIGDTPGETTVAVDLGPGRTAIAIAAGHSHACAILDDATLRCWGGNASGQLGQGSTIDYGVAPSETPARLPAIQLGGLLVGRDTDGDGVRDAIDRCATVTAATTNGCPAPAPAPSATPAPRPTPTPNPITPAPQAEALLSGKLLKLAAILRRTATAKRCPTTARATVTLTAGKKRSTRRATLRVKPITVAGKPRCRATGTLTLATKPAAKTTVRVTITGTGLKARTLTATR